MADGNGQGPWVTAIQRAATAAGVLLFGRRAIRFADERFVLTDAPSAVLKNATGSGQIVGCTDVTLTGVGEVDSIQGSTWIGIDSTDPASPIVAIDPAPSTTGAASRIVATDGDGAVAVTGGLHSTVSQWLASNADFFDTTKASVLGTNSLTATAPHAPFLLHVYQVSAWDGAAAHARKLVIGVIGGSSGGASILFANDTTGQLATIDDDGSVSLAGAIGVQDVTPTQGQIAVDGNGRPKFFLLGTGVRYVLAQGEVAPAGGSFTASLAGLTLANLASAPRLQLFRNNGSTTLTISGWTLSASTPALNADNTNNTAILLVLCDGAGNDTIIATMTNKTQTYGIRTDVAGATPSPATLAAGRTLYVKFIINEGIGTAIPANFNVNVGVSLAT